MGSVNLADIRAELEQELTWRSDEMRLLHNQLEFMEEEADRARYRKSLMVMLYSHFEGFCVTAFQIYLDAINSQKIKRKKLNTHLLASSMYDEFRAYDDPKRKPRHYRELFRRKPEEDTNLIHLAKRIDFLENIDQFLDEEAVIPENVVHAENNLNSTVLRKLLYSVGLPYDSLRAYDGNVEELVNRRNQIAHGHHKRGVSEATYHKIEHSIFHLLDEIIKLIYTSLHERKYLRSSS